MTLARARTGHDAWTNSDLPSRNYGDGVWLRIQGGSTVKHAFLFVKNPAPAGATVLSATLRIYEVGSFGASVTVDVKRIDARWSEAEIDADNEPGTTGATVSVTQTGSADATEWAFDVTAQLQTVCDGAAYYGFRLATSSTTERKFYSLNAADNRPVLEVEWSNKPDAPTELSPAGNSAVTVAKPTLMFNFHDVGGETAMGALQVQIDAANSFGTPDFDSGTVASSDPELDLTATAYGGLSTGADTWWRVRVQDAAGLWSAWSDSVKFQRVARGTLAIGSPTGGTVSDSSPTVIWSLTGATQTGYRVILADDADPTEPIFDTGRRASVATSLTLPKLVTDDTTTYRLTVRVWDVDTRVQTPGDPVHTEAVETFSFVEDPTPNAPTSLAANQVASGQPHVALTFNRATAPDEFVVWRDGKLLDHYDPTDIYVSGTQYRVVDRTAQPHASHTWKVRSKVSGVQGPAASVTYSFEVDAVWLCDLDTGKLVGVGATGSSFDMPEQAAVYTPVNGHKAVRIVQGMRGLEGSIQGRITDDFGSPVTYAENLEWMKKRPTQTYRLTVGGWNLPVRIGQVVIAPDPQASGANDRAVAFYFWAQDGITTR